jgi:hypothetical protein
VAGDDGCGDGSAKGRWWVELHGKAVAVVGEDGDLGLLERDGVDGGEGVAPPGRERGGARGLFGWEEGEDVAE